MSGKIVDKFLYEGLGFPIELRNVEMMSFGDELHPVIDVKEVAYATMQALMSQKNQLTGNQLAFVRTYLQMSTVDFANLIKISAEQLKQWEGLKDKTINMDAKFENSFKQSIQQQIFINKKNEEKENLKPEGKLSAKNLFSSEKTSPSASDKDQKQQPPVIKRKK